MPLLFSYGTLQQHTVQLRTLGRTLPGEGAALPGYCPARVLIADPSVATDLGASHHDNVVRDSAHDSRVIGTVFEVSDAELLRVDAFEQPFAYQRVLVTLESGKQAWVYVHRPAVGVSSIRLREVLPADLDVHFEQQRDPVANRMAGVRARDRAAFDAHWARNLQDPQNLWLTLEVDGRVAGNFVSWLLDGSRVVGYWLGREFWGRGLATAGLSQFLLQVRSRPLHAHVVAHNPASLRVLQKCGFRIVGSGQFPGLDGEPCDEHILRLGE